MILKAEREANLTTFGLYYSDILLEYRQIFYNLDNTAFAYILVQEVTPNEGITFLVEDSTLDVLMDYTVEPGNYTVNIKFVRTEGTTTHEIDLGSQVFKNLKVQERI